jgi:hypothetical protein
MNNAKILWFSNLNKWDLRKVVLNSNYSMTPFREFLQKCSVEYELLNPNKDYSILGVRSYGLGVYHNRIAKGNTLITKTIKQYQRIKAGNLFWCKVDTKNGAFGITQKEHENYYASSNMIQAKINDSVIIPDFLQFLFQNRVFQEYLDSKTTGSTNRKYISFNELLDIEIPLPKYEVQKEIIDDLTNIDDKIKLLQSEKKQLVDKINSDMFL